MLFVKTGVGPLAQNVRKKEAVLLSKLKHMQDRQWGGYLTPSEALSLIPHVIVSKYYTTWAIGAVESGDGRPQWFYFNVKPNSVWEAKLANR
jgi:hypothetical protein